MLQRNRIFFAEGVCSMSEFDDSLGTAVKKILTQLKFSQNVEMCLSNGKEKGQGYMGNIVTIYLRENSGSKDLNLVAKISIRNEKIRAGIPVTEAYKNEIHFYEHILPSLEELQRTINVSTLLNSIPKCFISCDEKNQEFLILEDLKTLHFEMFETKETMDYEHMKMLFQKYAEFHSLSFALKLRNNEKYLKLTQELYSMYMGFLECDTGTKLPECFQFIQKCLSEVGKPNGMVDEYTKSVDDILRNVLTQQSDTYSCILHGDSWSNNFMFKYKNQNGKKVLTEVKLIDWQACYFGSPVLDLSYALYSGCSKELLNDHFQLLKRYHETLTTSLSHLGYSSSEIYPFHVLEDQWKIYCHFGVILGVLVTKIKLTDKTNLSDPADTGPEDNSNYFEEVVTARAGCDVPELLNRVEYLFNHLKDIGVFDK